MNKYSFDLEIMNTLAYAEDALAKLTDDFKADKINYKFFIDQRIEIMKKIEEKIKIERSDLELLGSDLH